MIAGIILAAGRSARLGRPKQLLPVHGEPLLRHTVRRALASSLDTVLVVVGHEANAVRAAICDLPVRIVDNPDAAQGQSTSVIAGLAALNAPLDPGARAMQASPLQADIEAVMFLLGDQPGVEPEVIDALISAWREHGAPVVAPRYQDGIGNPILFDRAVFPDLLTLRGDTGARSIVRVRQQAGDLLQVPVDRPAPPDVDTEEDYAALLVSYAPNPRVLSANAQTAAKTSPSPRAQGEGVG